MHDLPDFPSAEALSESLHGQVYCATLGAAIEGQMIVGGTGEAPHRLTISVAGVVVETSVRDFPPEKLLVPRVVFDAVTAIARNGPSFPLTLTVERTEHKIRVDGRDRVFTAYTCRDSLGATARAGGVMSAKRTASALMCAKARSQFDRLVVCTVDFSRCALEGGNVAALPGGDSLFNVRVPRF
jgi:hypothetical protein